MKIIDVSYTASAALKTIVLLIGMMSFTDQFSAAQQMIVDDAEITTYRSVQFEGWYGTQESWIQPGIGVTQWLEIAPGLIFDSADGFETSNWLIELKTVPGDLEQDGWAYGLVAAPVFNTDNQIEEFFAYVPISTLMVRDSSVLHLNLGVEGFDVDGWEFGITTGARMDWGIADRVTILSEVFTTDLETPAFQAGLRFEIIEELVELDITYGQGFRSGMEYPGFNAGIAITPDSIW